MSFVEDVVQNNASSSVITRSTEGLIPSGLSIDPMNLFFGSLVIDGDSLVREFTVTNVGRKTLRIESVVLTGDNQFVLSGEYPELLRPNESFVMEVTYASNSLGQAVGIITVDTSEDRSPYYIGLSGRVIGSLQLEQVFEEFRALVTDEAYARATADEAEAAHRQLLAVTLGEDIAAAVLQEQTARVTQHESVASSLEVINGRFGENESAIIDERLVRIDEDTALAQRINSLEVVVGDGLSDNIARAAIEQEALVRADADSAEALLRTQLGVSLNNTIDARIDQEHTAWVAGDEAEASAREALSVSLQLDTDTKISSAILNEAQARIDGDTAEATARQSLEVELKQDATTKVNAAINLEAQARVTADNAHTEEIATLTSELTILNGTVGGFATSIEDTKTDVVNLAGVVTAKATQLDEVSAQAINGGNDLANTEFATNLDGWNLSWNTASAQTMQRAAIENTLGTGTIQIAQNSVGDVDTTLHARITSTDFLPTISGRRYQFTVYSGVLRCKADIVITWFDVLQASLGSSVVDAASTNDEEASGGTYIQQYKRLGVFAVAPPGAVFAKVNIRKYTTKSAQTSSFAYFARPQFKEANQRQTAFDSYVAGSATKSLMASVTEVSSALAATNGKLEASYALTVTAGKRVAGMKLLATEEASALNFTADAIGFALADGDPSKKLMTLGLRNGVPTVVLNGDLYADGSITANALNVGRSSNLLVNSELINTRGWSVYDGTAGSMDAINTNVNKPDAAYQLAGGNTLGIRQNGATQNLIIWYSDIACEPGKRYEFSGYLAAHRASVFIRIEWYNAARNTLYGTTDSPSMTGGGGTALAHYSRMFGFGIAPANAYIARFCFIKLGTMQGFNFADSWAWMTHPYLGVASVSQTTPSEYSPAGIGTFIGPDGIITNNLSAISANMGHVTTGQLDIGSDANGGWGYARSAGKWWGDGQNGWVNAREPGGDSFTEFKNGVSRIWISSWGDCGIQFPGIRMTQGGLTIDQLNVINTANIAGNAVTIPIGVYTSGSKVVSATTITTEVQTAYITSTGGPIFVFGGTTIAVTNPGSGTSEAQFYIYRNGVLVFQSTSAAAVTTTATGMVMDTPGAGTHTYELRIMPGQSVNARQRSLLLLETKR